MDLVADLKKLIIEKIPEGVGVKKSEEIFRFLGIEKNLVSERDKYSALKEIGIDYILCLEGV
jgi:hypothetical protein